MVKRNLRLGFVLFTIAAAVSLIAQPPGGGRGGRGGMMGGGNNPLSLLSNKSVQDELKITADQKRQIDELNAKMREEMQAMRENMQSSGGDMQAMRAAMEKMTAENQKKVDAILDEKQRGRLKEIRIQLDGARAILNPDVQKELGITAEQKAQIDAAQKANNELRQQMMEDMRGGGGDREQMQAQMQKLNTDFLANLTKILTTAQADKLKAMGGAPFKIVRDGGN